jgi:hypothetical protein
MPQQHRPTHDRTTAQQWTRLVAVTLVSASVLLGGLLSAA